MLNEQTFFDWEEPFEPLANIESDIYVNGTLKLTDIKLDRIEIIREDSSIFNLHFYTKQPIHAALIKSESKHYNFNIEIRIKEKFPRLGYQSITLYNANFGTEKRSYANDYVETAIRVYRIIYSSDRESTILKEWYGCKNKLNFHKGIASSKIIEKTITYKDGNRNSFKIRDRAEDYNIHSFWVKLKDYKFKVSIVKSSNDEHSYTQYALEYRKDWGLIPDEDVRFDISTFLSFIIGTKLVKFGETHFNTDYIAKKEYIAPNPLDSSLLYQTNFSFYNDDYRRNDTHNVIKQIPKMLNRYFLLKEKYRLNEVLSILFIHSYLNFNFVSYVTYIEMFSNIEVEQKPTILTKSKFKSVLKSLNAVKNIPQSIKSKFQDLNKIGIGKKVQRLLKKHKIDYGRYKEVFSVRGKVVHGADVDIQEMYIASKQAKELLTILTLKKLGYAGYIRNFTNNNELLLLKDFSKLLL